MHLVSLGIGGPYPSFFSNTTCFGTSLGKYILAFKFIALERSSLLEEVFQNVIARSLWANRGDSIRSYFCRRSRIYRVIHLP